MLYKCNIVAQTPDFKVTLTWIGLNLVQFVCKNFHKRLKPALTPWPVAWGLAVLPYPLSLIKKLPETIPRFPLKSQLPTPWLQKSSIAYCNHLLQLSAYLIIQTCFINFPLGIRFCDCSLKQKVLKQNILLTITLHLCHYQRKSMEIHSFTLVNVHLPCQWMSLKS